MPVPPFNLKGLWSFVGQQGVRDDILAKRLGHVDFRGLVITHGTYTRELYYRIRMSSRNGVDDAVLDLFDEHARFIRFVWNGDNAWVASNEIAQLQIGTTDHPGVHVLMSPGLILTASDPTNPDWPRNGTDNIGTPCPMKRRDDQGSDSLPVQMIIPGEDEDEFRWVVPASGTAAEIKLKFDRELPQQSEPTQKNGVSQTWGDLFNQSIPQNNYPFLGFEPRNLNIYTDQVASAGTEVGSLPTNPNETFGGKLIFAFPQADSTDYVKSDLGSAPLLPLGLRAFLSTSTREEAHTRILSSVEDHVNSWSTSLGLNAAFGKLFSLGVSSSFSEKIDTQKKNESRLTISKVVATAHAVVHDVPTMQLDSHYRNEILEIRRQLDRGETPDWENFVAEFGTHYCYAMTSGSIAFDETTYSLSAETTARLNKVSLNANAEQVLDGAKNKASIGTDQEFGGKLGKEVSKEDVSRHSVGSDTTPVGIFFDLRPQDELLNPVHFPYDPAGSEDELKAPVVWYDLRNSFRSYLESKGLGQPLDPADRNDLTPRVVNVTIPSATVMVPTAYNPQPRFGSFPMIIFHAALTFNDESNLIFFSKTDVDLGRDEDTGTFVAHNNGNLAPWTTATATVAQTFSQAAAGGHFDLQALVETLPDTVHETQASVALTVSLQMPTPVLQDHTYGSQGYTFAIRTSLEELFPIDEPVSPQRSAAVSPPARTVLLHAGPGTTMVHSGASGTALVHRFRGAAHALVLPNPGNDSVTVTAHQAAVAKLGEWAATVRRFINSFAKREVITELEKFISDENLKDRNKNDIEGFKGLWDDIKGRMADGAHRTIYTLSAGENGNDAYERLTNYLVSTFGFDRGNDRFKIIVILVVTYAFAQNVNLSDFRKDTALKGNEDLEFLTQVQALEGIRGMLEFGVANLTEADRGPAQVIPVHRQINTLGTADMDLDEGSMREARASIVKDEEDKNRVDAADVRAADSQTDALASAGLPVKDSHGDPIYDVVPPAVGEVNTPLLAASEPIYQHLQLSDPDEFEKLELKQRSTYDSLGSPLALALQAQAEGNDPTSTLRDNLNDVLQKPPEFFKATVERLREDQEEREERHPPAPPLAAVARAGELTRRISDRDNA